MILFAFVACVSPFGLGACSEELEAFPDHYVGIGVELDMETTGARVVRVLEGGPAAAAHFSGGDLILQADSTSLRGKTLAQVVSLLRGAEDSKLNLIVQKKTVKRPRVP
ncbi:MAG: PDZ domain-containing protein [Deltaproteobacteria bacterium]|nr:PDZ domain-containing protein [Deltaproteobacteria bacterium]